MSKRSPAVAFTCRSVVFRSSGQNLTRTGAYIEMISHGFPRTPPACGTAGPAIVVGAPAPRCGDGSGMRDNMGLIRPPLPRSSVNRRVSWGVLAVGSVGVLFGIGDVIGSGRVGPQHVFAVFVLLGAGAGILKESRPWAARVLGVGASVLLVLAGSVAGYRAWAAFLAGGTRDWLGLLLGVVIALWGVAAARSFIRRSRGDADTITG